MAYTLSVLKGATAILTRVFLSVMLLIKKRLGMPGHFSSGRPTTTVNKGLYFILDTLYY